MIRNYLLDILAVLVGLQKIQVYVEMNRSRVIQLVETMST